MQNTNKNIHCVLFACLHILCCMAHLYPMHPLVPVLSPVLSVYRPSGNNYISVGREKFCNPLESQEYGRR